MENKITIGYWGIKGRAETIRWLLHYLGKEYNEENPDMAGWKDKAATLKADGLHFPNLPYLIDGDWKMSETRAIKYYIANKYGRPELFGKDWKETARLGELEGVYKDVREAISKAFMTPEYKTKVQEAVKEGSKVHNKLTLLSKALGDKDWFVGHVTYFEIGFAYFLTMSDEFFAGAGVENVFHQFENFTALKERVINLPGIKEHLASDKGKLPFLPPMMLPWNKA